LNGTGDVGVGTGEIDEVGDGLERIVDFVGDGGGETAGGGELFALAEGGLLGFAGGDVPHGADHAGDDGGAGSEGGNAAGGDPGGEAAGRIDSALGAVVAAGVEGAAEACGNFNEVFRGDDTMAELGAGDGDVGLGEEEVGGSLVEIEEVGGTIPGPGTELFGVEGMTEAAGGLKLEGVRGVDESDLAGEAFGEANVIDGDGGLRGDGGDETFAERGEDVDVGMAVDEAAEDIATAAADGDGEITSHGRVAGRHSGERKVVTVAGIEGDVG